MKSCYINGIGSVSAQDSSNEMENFVELTHNITDAHKPNYREYIKPALIRRMANGVKMGVVASAMAMKEAGLSMPEAIVTGSGLGCLKDSEKFLKDIIYNDEQYLTPTAFIQSTHNTVGAQIALGLGCKAYNVTYVHGATSFESSLIDAKLLMLEGLTNILVGGVDEIGAYNASLQQSIARIKQEPVLNCRLLDSKTSGTIMSEGAQFFVLSDEKTEGTYAELVDVEIYNHIESAEIEEKLKLFLSANSMSVTDIDAVFLGLNGDSEQDGIYRSLQTSIFEHSQQLYFKHFSGDYDTVSSFAMWSACQMLKSQKIPVSFKLNNKSKNDINTMLIYNQIRGEYHSFSLLRVC